MCHQVKLFKKLRTDAGLTVPLTPHILRHTYCTNLLNNGVDITLIRDLAGHSDIKTTAKYYLKVSPDALRRAAEKVNYGPETFPTPLVGDMLAT